VLWHRALSIFKKNPTLYIAVGLLLLALLFYLPSLGREARLEESRQQWSQRHQQMLDQKNTLEREVEKLFQESQQILEDGQDWSRRAEELESYIIEDQGD
jgi:membrane protein implicated in regulation of membrane protease activity